MEHNVVKLVNATDRRRIVNSICSCMPADNLKTLLTEDVPLFEFARRDGNDPGIVREIVRLIKRVRPDIVHSHTWGTLCEAFLAARLARVPVLVHGEHGTMNLRPRNKIVQRVLWKRVDRLLSVSSSLADTMSQYIGIDRSLIRVIYNGVKIERFMSGNPRIVRDELKLGEDEVLIVTVGRMEPVKDHATLLAAAGQLHRAGVTFRLVIVGEGTLRPELEGAVSREGLRGMVHFLGHRNDIEHVLAAADIFVLSSRSEGLPNGIMEAMAAGIAVVSTAVGGAAELVVNERTGLLVPAQSPDALATALERLVRDGATRRMFGNAGRDRTLEKFTFARMVDQYEDLYLAAARECSRLSGLFRDPDVAGIEREAKPSC
ncbi:MAG TPA: glycosyltransferase [Vicinamibacterales bacterium]